MHNYVAFVYSGIPEPTGDLLEDGRKLALDCVQKIQTLEDPDHFPPRLFILLATPAFMDFSLFLAGIHSVLVKNHLNEIPLIGTSVAACLFKEDIYPKGAVLICLASRLLKVQAAVSPNARKDPKWAVGELIKKFDISSSLGMNPRGSFTFMIFMPGFGEGEYAGSYCAREIHRHLRDLTLDRISIFGGVSSMNDRTKAGFQFCGRYVYKDVVVAATLDSGFPVAMGMWDGFKSSGKYLHVLKLSEDKRNIIEFSEGKPIEVLRKKDKEHIILLKEISPSGEQLVALPQFVNDGKEINLMRLIDEKVTLEIIYSDKDTIRNTAKEVIMRSHKRMKINNVCGLFIIVCKARYEHLYKTGIDIKENMNLADNMFPGIPIVAVYMDGEAGVDFSGRSAFGNWMECSLTIGDEIQERSLVFRGFGGLSQYKTRISEKGLVKETVKWALDIIWEAGFHGAMLSLVFESIEKRYIIAQDARGKRFKKIVEHTKRELPGDDVLALVSEEKKPRFIRDSNDPKENCNPEAICKSGIISQYIIPLLSARGNVLGVLQIDLGEMRYLEYLPETIRNIFDSFGTTIASSLDQAFQTEELEFTRKLDEAMSESLLLDSLESALNSFIEKAAETIQVPKSHIRILDQETGRLKLIAGIGKYYNIARKDRIYIDTQERAPAALAFRKGEMIIVNDIEENVEGQEIRKFFKGTEIGEALGDNQSYVNIVIKDSQNTRIGVMNLSSTQKWFFCQSHVRSIKDFGIKLGYLIEFFRRKDSERLAADEAGKRAKDLDFLKKATPQLIPREKPDFNSALRKGIKELRNAANADIVSLFLWDEDLHYYILRFQDGWAKPEWVDAARYLTDEGWTGSTGIQLNPRYIPDLKKWKKDTHAGLGKYAKYMFSPPITETEEETAEVIGVPLRIGYRSLGVLTMHRRIKQNQDVKCGFTTINDSLLKEVMENLSSFIATMQWFEEADYQKISSNCIAGIGEILSKEDLILNEVCREIGTHLGSSAVAIYLKNEMGSSLLIHGKYIASSRNMDIKYEITESDNDFAWRTYKGVVRRIKRIEVRNEEKNVPERMKFEGMIERYCVPLKESDNIFGVLDIQWENDLIDINRHNGVFIKNFMRDIVEKISAALHLKNLRSEKENARKKEEDTKRNIAGMSAMVFQSSHRMGNLLKNVRILVNDIMKSSDGKERVELIKELVDEANKGIKEIPKPRDVARGILREERQKQSLFSLWKKTIEQIRIPDSMPVISNLNYERNDFQLYVNPKQILQVFHNIVSNAFKSMKEKDAPGMLSISARQMKDDKIVKITIADTGQGMTDEQIKAAKTGFTPTPSGYGVGVFLSVLLCNANGGDLDIKSNIGSGTEVKITLPLFERKKT